MRSDVLLVCCIVALFSSVTARADMAVWSENPMVKVHPTDPPKATPLLISISAARNEYEPFQVIVRSGTRPLRGVDVDVSDFVGLNLPDGPNGQIRSRGHQISCRENCTIYRELYTSISQPSGPYGSVGEWPDALIPKVDRYVGERRNAFPFDVAENRNQPVWIDVYVPAGTPAGLYIAYVSIRAETEQTIRIPVRLTVWSFTLPSTSSIKNAFLVWGGALPHGHGSSFVGDSLDKLVWMYSKALLAHRISNGWLLSGQDWQPTAFTGPEADASTQLKRALGPFFDGTALPNGAQITAVVPPYQACLGGVIGSETGQDPPIQFAGTLCNPNMVSALPSSGWLSRTSFYLPDEPNLSDTHVLQTVQSIASQIHGTSPLLRTLVTHSYSRLLESATDAWIVPLTELDQSFNDGTYWSTYALEKDRGKQIWVYQSCLSHICGVTSLFPGLPDWPDYMIDMQGMKNRVQDWINWKFRVDGELYWGVNYSYYWTDAYGDQFIAGGNGDGNFLYPGAPERIGGKTGIPIESIRLKLKREGLEDYEYLALVSALGDRSLADNITERMARSATVWEHDPTALYDVRRQLATRIEALLAVLGGR